MDLFESPLFWIILVWWLISTLLGAQARKRRRAQAAAAQEKVREQLTQEKGKQSGEPAAVVESDWRESPRGREAPSVREPEVFTSRPEVRRPASLTDIWREMQKGLTPATIQPATRWEEEEYEEEPEPEVQEIPVAAARVATAYEEMLDTGVPLPSEVMEPEKVSVPVLDRFISLDLNSWQQAVVLKEVLDRPRAYRRQIR